MTYQKPIAIERTMRATIALTNPFPAVLRHPSRRPENFIHSRCCCAWRLGVNPHLSMHREAQHPSLADSEIASATSFLNSNRSMSLNGISPFSDRALSARIIAYFVPKCLLFLELFAVSKAFPSSPGPSSATGPEACGLSAAPEPPGSNLSASRRIRAVPIQADFCSIPEFSS